MYYKIGTLAKRFKISAQTIRYYEQQGFLMPVRDDSTTRRYHARNLKLLSSIRRYYEMGFGTKEIQSLFACRKIDQIETMIKSKEEQIERQIHALQHNLCVLRQKQADIARIDAQYMRCSVEPSPTFWVLVDQDGQKLYESEALESELGAWIDHIDSVYSAVVVEKSAIEQNNEYSGRKSGFLIEAENAKQLDIPFSEHVYEVHFDMCLHTVTRRSPAFSEFEHILRFLSEEQLEITGYALARCLLKVGEDRCLDEPVIPDALYYEYFIPVRRMNKS